MAEVYVTKEGLHVLNDSYKHELSKLMEVSDMEEMEDKENMDILQYFNETASKDDWELVQDVYNRELASLLKELGMEGKKEFNLAELTVIYTRTCLEKDLALEELYDQEYGCGHNSDIKAIYIDDMRDALEEHKEEEK